VETIDTNEAGEAEDELEEAFSPAQFFFFQKSLLMPSHTKMFDIVLVIIVDYNYIITITTLNYFNFDRWFYLTMKR